MNPSIGFALFPKVGIRSAVKAGEVAIELRAKYALFVPLLWLFLSSNCTRIFPNYLSPDASDRNDAGDQDADLEPDKDTDLEEDTSRRDAENDSDPTDTDLDADFDEPTDADPDADPDADVEPDADPDEDPDDDEPVIYPDFADPCGFDEDCTSGVCFDLHDFDDWCYGRACSAECEDDFQCQLYAVSASAPNPTDAFCTPERSGERWICHISEIGLGIWPCE